MYATRTQPQAAALIGLLGLLATACASPAGGGGGGSGFVGGGIGTACAPTVHKQGCAPGTAIRVECDAASSTWAQLGACPANHACVEAVDPSDGAFRIATCVALGGGAQDTAAAGDGGNVADGGPTTDAGLADGAADAGAADAGLTDSGASDTGSTDSGAPDTGNPDAGNPDTGNPDTGNPDTGSPDTGNPDTGSPDAGSADAGGTTLGCGSATDAAFIKLLYASSSLTNSVTSAVTSCTLTKGCMAKSGDQAQQACIRDCLMQDSAVQSNNVSAGCMACFATHKGWCGAKKCIAKCAVDPGSAGCQQCLATHCDPAFEACVGAGAGAVCGDGKCEGSESASSCAADCAAASKGCMSANDVAFNTLLNSSSSATNQFTSDVKSCTLTKGCLAKSSDQQQKDCIRDCLLDTSLAKSNNLSASCAGCYGTWKGWCGAKKCIGSCAVDAGSTACQQCLASNCDGSFDLCVAGKL